MAINFKLDYGISNKLSLSLSANSGTGTAENINTQIFELLEQHASILL